MRKLVASIFMTLDGVVEDPGGAERSEFGGWSFRYAGWSGDGLAYNKAQLFQSDALLLGRVTYEGFARAWPTMTDPDGYADRMNSLPKYVVSSTLEQAEWRNSRVVRGGLEAEVAALKAEEGGDILIFGSGQLVTGLLRAGLLDELRLWVYPVVLGRGKRLFDGGSPVALALDDTRRLESGVLLMTYAPARA